MGVEDGLVGDRHTGVLGGPRELEGLGAVEGGRGADLTGLVKLYSLRVSKMLRRNLISPDHGIQKRTEFPFTTALAAALALPAVPVETRLVSFLIIMVACVRCRNIAI